MDIGNSLNPAIDIGQVRKIEKNEEKNELSEKIK